jgi:hypothetical protein
LAENGRWHLSWHPLAALQLPVPSEAASDAGDVETVVVKRGRDRYAARCLHPAKVRQLVRPLDVVTRPEANMFAVITLQPDIENCTSQSFRRIFDNLYMHSFKTTEGFIPVVVGVSISAADADTGFPHPKQFMRHAYDGLARSFDTGLITVQQFDPATAQVPEQ